MHTHTHIYICYSINLKFTLKHLKRPYIFRSHDHPQEAYVVPCQRYSLKTLSDLHRYDNFVL